MNRKLQSALIFGGIAALVAYWTPHFYHRHNLAEGRPADPGNARAPAASGEIALSIPPLAASPDVCGNIYHTVCHYRGATHDPTGTVEPDIDGDKMAVHTVEEIIRAHPDWSSEQIDAELVNQVYTPKRRGRVESAYRYVVHALIRFIDLQPEEVFTAHEKRLLKARVRKTQLQLPPPASVYADEPDLFTKNEVFYERMMDGQTRMRVGGAYLFTAKSWFNVVFTLAHELGHAIDPCEIRHARMSIPAYDRLTACFMRNGLIAQTKTRSECGEDDQLSETFADWVAVHVTADALRSYSVEFPGPQLWNAATNSVRDLCEQEGDDVLDTAYHPPPEVRIDRIFGRNPEIRAVLGCQPAPPDPEYCDFRTTSPNHVSPIRRTIGGRFQSGDL